MEWGRMGDATFAQEVARFAGVGQMGWRMPRRTAGGDRMIAADAYRCAEGWCRDVTTWPHPVAVAAFLVVLVLVWRWCRD